MTRLALALGTSALLAGGLALWWRYGVQVALSDAGWLCWAG